MGKTGSIHAQLDRDFQRMLTLTYHGRTSIPVEVEGIVPEALRRRFRTAHATLAAAPNVAPESA